MAEWINNVDGMAIGNLDRTHKTFFFGCVVVLYINSNQHTPVQICLHLWKMFFCLHYWIFPWWKEGVARVLKSRLINKSLLLGHCFENGGNLQAPLLHWFQIDINLLFLEIESEHVIVGNADIGDFLLPDLAEVLKIDSNIRNTI